MNRYILSFLFFCGVLTAAASVQTQSAAASGQNTAEARRVLDKTSAVVGRKGGASASFTLSSPQAGSVSGTVAIRGNKFHARTPQAIVWYNGKTQWSYLKKTNEVNVSTPTQAQQMSMNPYTFIHLYKTGYTLSMKTTSAGYEVHLTAQNKQRSVQEMYITINRRTYVPSKVRLRQGSTWTTVSLSNFEARNQPAGLFTFSAKDFPTAEVIDLR